MRRVRFAAVVAAAATAVLAFPATANAATINQPFAADSGDSCPYGSTAGTLGWQYGISTSPLPVTAVAVTGKLTDRPTPADPSAACRSDGYSSTVTVVAYAGTVEVARQSRTADNATISFAFTLSGSRTTSIGINRVVVQVCRNPVVTLPPSYCGKAVTYLAPPIA
jgi:hypothetical protein